MLRHIQTLAQLDIELACSGFFFLQVVYCIKIWNLWSWMVQLFGPGKIFWLMAQGGIDSTQHIQTLITPELQKIKNPFLLHEKLNFLTISLKLYSTIIFATLIFNEFQN